MAKKPAVDPGEFYLDLVTGELADFSWDELGAVLTDSLAAAAAAGLDSAQLVGGASIDGDVAELAREVVGVRSGRIRTH